MDSSAATPVASATISRGHRAEVDSSEAIEPVIENIETSASVPSGVDEKTTSLTDLESQAGVKRAEAITLVWTRGALIAAYIW